MTDRAQRRARVRRGVAAGAAALLLASFGAVATFGRQPAAKVAVTPAPAPAQEYGYDDPYEYEQPEDQQAAPQEQQDTGPAPLTTRQS